MHSGNKNIRTYCMLKSVDEVVYGKKSLVPNCNTLAYRKGKNNLELISRSLVSALRGDNLFYFSFCSIPTAGDTI